MKDTHNLRLKFREIHRQYDSPRMENQIAAQRQQLDVAAMY